MSIESILHGLAYFGVWLLNALVLEVICIVLWFAVALPVWSIKRLDENRQMDIIMGWAIVLCVLFFLAIIGYCFGWPRIIPLPKF